VLKGGRGVFCFGLDERIIMTRIPQYPIVELDAMMRARKYWPILCAAFILLLSTSLTACKEPPTISVYPSSLSFVVEEGKGNPPSQTVSISDSGGGNLEWSLTSSADWLTLNPSTGISTGEIDAATVLVDVQGMKAGNHAAIITISASKATNSPQTVAVNLIINAPIKETPEVAWETYQDLEYRYSIQYPTDWTLSVHGLGTVGKYSPWIYDETGEPQYLGVGADAEERPSLSLDEEVARQIEINTRDGKLTLRSSDKIIYMGLDAWLVEYSYVSTWNPPWEANRSRESFRKEMILYYRDYMYEVKMYGRESSYKVWGTTADRIFNSFQPLP